MKWKLQTGALCSKVKIISQMTCLQTRFIYFQLKESPDLKLKEEITFSLYLREEADFERDKIPVTSPIGKLLLVKEWNSGGFRFLDGLIKYKILEISKLV